MPSTLLDVLEHRRLFASLTAGVTTTTSITTSATTKNWTITLKAGQAVVLAVGDTGTTSFAPEVTLIAPNGSTVATASGDKGAFLSKTASTAGTYTVRVRDVGQNQAGTVKVTAFYTGSTAITDGDDAFTAQSGRRFAATIEPGDLDVWRIDGKAGQFLSVVATENKVGDPVDPGVILVGPDGKVIVTKTSETGIKIDQPNIKTGTYYAVAFESGADNTARYGISFGQTPGVQTPEDPDTQKVLTSGETRTGDAPGGDIDLFQVSLTAGKKISLTAVRGSTGSLDPELLIIDPTGKVVATANGSTTATLSYTTLTAGTFSFLLRDRESDDGGQYKLTYKLS